MIGSLFIPILKSSISEKFGIQPDEIKKVTYFINKSSDKITITCNDDLKKEIDNSEKLHTASMLIANAIQNPVKEDFVEYILEMVFKENEFHSSVYIVTQNGEKIKQELKKII